MRGPRLRRRRAPGGRRPAPRRGLARRAGMGRPQPPAAGRRVGRGFAATALAAEPPAGLVGIVSFAGGRGSRGPKDVCRPDRLVEAFARYGRTARAPALWIYAENDLYFGPELSRAMHAAYRAGGAPAEFHLLPPFGQDGHSVYGRAQELWWPLVDGFLRAHGLPTGRRGPERGPPAGGRRAPSRRAGALPAGPGKGVRRRGDGTVRVGDRAQLDPGCARRRTDLLRRPQRGRLPAPVRQPRPRRP